MGSNQTNWQIIDSDVVKRCRLPIENAVPGVVDILAYWQGRCRGADLPRKADIHPWDLKEQLGRLCIIEVQVEPLDFIYRLDGSNIASVTQQDLTGQSVLSVTPEEYANAIYEDLRETLVVNAPLLWHVDLNIPPAVYPYQRLVLPLTSGEGAAITHLMTYSHRLDSRDGAFPWFKRYGQPD